MSDTALHRALKAQDLTSPCEATSLCANGRETTTQAIMRVASKIQAIPTVWDMRCATRMFREANAFMLVFGGAIRRSTPGQSHVSPGSRRVAARTKRRYHGQMTLTH